MSRYDGLIIPRSYSEYINKTDAETLQQALQLSGVLSNAVANGDNKAVTSNAVNNALIGYQRQKELIVPDTNNIGLQVSFDTTVTAVGRPCALIVYGYGGVDLIRFSTANITTGVVVNINGGVITYDNTTGIIKSTNSNRRLIFLYPQNIILTQVTVT